MEPGPVHTFRLGFVGFGDGGQRSFCCVSILSHGLVHHVYGPLLVSAGRLVTEGGTLVGSDQMNRAVTAKLLLKFSVCLNLNV